MGEDDAIEDDAIEDESDNSGGSERGYRPCKRPRCKSDFTDRPPRPPFELPMSVTKQNVIRMGELEDLFDLWCCEDIDEWLRPNWAKIWDSFDFSEDPCDPSGGSFCAAVSAAIASHSLSSC